MRSILGPHRGCIRKGPPFKICIRSFARSFLNLSSKARHLSRCWTRPAAEENVNHAEKEDHSALCPGLCSNFWKIAYRGPWPGIQGITDTHVWSQSTKTHSRGDGSPSGRWLPPGRVGKRGGDCETSLLIHPSCFISF